MNTAIKIKLFINSRIKKVEAILSSINIAIGALLLGIWAIKGTIALRNILLWLGLAVSVSYLFILYKKKRINLSIKSLAPCILMAGIFLWVLLHYLFFTEYPQQQFQELSSTWLRCLLSSILGFAIGLSIPSKKYSIQWLCAGLFGAWIAIYMQYIPVAISAREIVMFDYRASFFAGKINGVVVGNTLVSLLLAGIIFKRDGNKKSDIILAYISISIIATILFGYVYVLDTRNGIGLFLLILIPFLGIYSKNYKNTYVKLSMILCIVFITALFFKLQFKNNIGWNNFIEDIYISAQIDKYKNWKNENLGYPKRVSGEEVTGNTYNRIAWIFAGSRLVFNNPVGVGALYHPFEKSLILEYPAEKIQGIPKSTHSGWVDFGLAYGIIGVFCFWSAFLMLLIRSFNSGNKYSVFMQMGLYGLFFLYFFGEVMMQHNLEFLFFWVQLFIGLDLYSRIIGK